jgi:hypothetical protein
MMRRAFLALTAITAAAITAPGRASALDVTCIEASRYRHLYQLFDGDPRQLAAFLQLDPRRLPRPEHCRAMLLSGKIEGRADIDKLLAAIDASEGWLTSLHLSSPGGSVTTGYRLGFIVRLFWLKTQTAVASRRNLHYTPDFIVPPVLAGSDPAVADADERIRNWRRYLAVQRDLEPIPLYSTTCVSACTYVHIAGIDRMGKVNVHRARRSGSTSMSDVDIRLRRLELHAIEFYRQMDPGPEVIRLRNATPTQTTTPIDVVRFPRYVADYLTGKCKVNGDQLYELDRQFSATIAELSEPQFGYRIKTDHLNSSLRQLRDFRAEAERCIAAAHESERRSHFAKLCPSGCDRTRVLRTVDERSRALEKQ